MTFEVNTVNGICPLTNVSGRGQYLLQTIR